MLKNKFELIEVDVYKASDDEDAERFAKKLRPRSSNMWWHLRGEPESVLSEVRERYASFKNSHPDINMRSVSSFMIQYAHQARIPLDKLSDDTGMVAELI